MPKAHLREPGQLLAVFSDEVTAQGLEILPQVRPQVVHLVVQLLLAAALPASVAVRGYWISRGVLDSTLL